MLPSILDLERQLQRLEPLDQPEVRQAVRVAKALLSHLRNFGTPATPPASAKVQAQSLALRTVGLPAHLVRPRSGTVIAAAVPASTPAQRLAKAQAQTNGVTMEQIAERVGFSRAYLNNLLWNEVLPRPAHNSAGNLPAMWTQEQADQIAEIMADPERRKVPRPAQEPLPPDWVSAEGFCERLGYKGVSRIHALVSDGDLPAADFRRGRRVYWRESVVAECAATHRRGPPRNRKPKDPA